MKRLLTLLALAIAAPALAISDARPPQVNNSAAPQDAELNIGTATVRGTATVGSIKLQGGPTYDATHLPGFVANATNYIQNSGTGSAPAFTVAGATVTGNGWTKGQIFAGPSSRTVTTADGHTDATNLTGNLPTLGGGSLTGLTTAQVGLSNVKNVDQTDAGNITSGTLAGARTPGYSGAIVKAPGATTTTFGQQVSPSTGIAPGQLSTSVQTTSMSVVSLRNQVQAGANVTVTQVADHLVVAATGGGTGDMSRSVYDADHNGAADVADALANQVSQSTGITGVTPIANGGTGATSASAARTALGTVVGTDVEAHDTDLTALAGVSSNGLLARTGSGAAAARTLSANTTYLSYTNGDGVAGNPTLDMSTMTLTRNDINSIAKLETLLNANIDTSTEAVDAARLSGTLPAIDGGSVLNLTPANLAAGNVPSNVKVSSVDINALFGMLAAGSNVTITKGATTITISATGGGGANAIILSTGGVQMSTGAAQIDFRQQHFNIKLVRAGVYQVELATGAVTTSIIADQNVTFAKLFQEASISTGQVLAKGAGGGITGLTALTTFYDLERYGTPDFGLSTANTYDATASTNPYFGRMRFDGSASSTTNCGIYDSNIAPNDWNTTLDPRLNQFQVKIGTATDDFKQRYVLRVATITDNARTLTLSFTAPVNVDVAAGTGSNSLANRTIAAPLTLTGWGGIIVPGMPYAVEVCRAGSDGTNDVSGIDSFMVAMQTRYAHTAPGS